MLPTVHCVKSVYIRSFSGPHFNAFGLNAERYNLGPNIYDVHMDEGWRSLEICHVFADSIVFKQ